jgi:peptidoglycan L-alanyl-D-glutamate endopeptidase CwlK
MDDVSEERLAQVYPELAEKIRQMASTLTAANINIRVTAGLRTVAEQDELYAKGRTTPGPIVTNAKGGQSYHNLGMAVDIVPSVDAFDLPYLPDWDESHPAWKHMIKIGESLGLNCGADWEHFKDMPHFQLTGKWPVGEPPEEALNLLTNGIEQVWDAAYSA